ncbi:MAG: hypothetical protein ACFCUL_14380 [Flavobacteriaceae bacterium]
MRYLTFFYITLLLIQTSQAQNKEKYEFSVGYGIVKNSYPTRNNVQGLGYDTPAFGKAFEFSMDILLSENRYLGLGYSLQSSSRTINNSVELNFEGTSAGLGILWDNYRLENETQFYDLHYRQVFSKKLNLTLGFFYYRRFSGDLDLNTDQFDIAYFVLSDQKFRGDDFGLSLSGMYMLTLKEYLKIGLQARVYYSFSGTEAFTATPVVRFSF